MASYSLSGYRKDACNGNSVLALSVDGVAVFCFIGWMQHTCKDRLSLNDGGSNETLNVARALAGQPVDRRQRGADEFTMRAGYAVHAQRFIAEEMNKARYARKLQDNGAHHSFMSRVHLTEAARFRNEGRIYNEQDYRDAASAEQRMAALQFQRLAGVRGLFDTPTMDDSHAVECEVSRVDAPRFAYIDACKASYRERAYNAYGRYAMYCARACVTPYGFPEWFADLYMGHESDPAANWN